MNKRSDLEMTYDELNASFKVNAVNMKKRALVWTATLCLCVFALTIHSKISNPHLILEQSNQLTLYALDPETKYQNESNQSKKAASHERFQGYIVLGKTIVGDPIIKKRLTNALHGKEEPDQEFKAGNPSQYGIRATWLWQTTDIEVVFDGFGAAGFYGPSLLWPLLKNESYESFSNATQPLFNKVLDDAKVPRSKPRD